jgi:uncharacterized metal-binding protein
MKVLREAKMVDLPEKKIGIVACSGEEMPEGTVTRLAALKVLEQLRPKDTVTICLPLFLAGGEGDRAFARFYPTIAVDGCEQRCAARATELFSGKPAAEIVVSEVLSKQGMTQPQGCRRLDEAGKQAVDVVAAMMAEEVDDLMGVRWSRIRGDAIELEIDPESQVARQATCSCASGIPVKDVVIDGQAVTVVALPLIFQNLREAGKEPSDQLARELIDTVKIYNPIPQDVEETFALALLQEYRAYCEKEAPV